MKNKRLLLIAAVLILSSCVNGGGTGSESSQDTSSGTSGDTSSNTSSDTASDTVSSVTGDTSSSSETGRPTSGTEIIDFYAINDFHGAISKNDYFGEPGLARVAAYLKDKKDDAPENSSLSALAICGRALTIHIIIAAASSPKQWMISALIR